jgi:hypothetical protein
VPGIFPGQRKEERKKERSLGKSQAIEWWVRCADGDGGGGGGGGGGRGGGGGLSAVSDRFKGLDFSSSRGNWSGTRVSDACAT